MSEHEEQPTPYTRDWAYHVTRRTEHDHDATYLSHLPHVRSVDHLSVPLRPYQQRAVAWMLQREHAASGGLLCDDMGLGKTLELLQLIVCHPRSPLSASAAVQTVSVSPHGQCPACARPVPSSVSPCEECQLPIHPACVRDCRTRQNKPAARVCVRCATNLETLCAAGTSSETLLPSDATLIVVPAALLLQWQDELERHAPHLRVVVVNGYVPQRRLLTAHVVLASYDALRADVHAAIALRSPRNPRRRPPRFHRTPVTLLTVRWWRVAFDEAQMLGSGATTVAKMATFLHASFRWCVTGTPIRRVLSDAHNMFDMIHLVEDADTHKKVHWQSLFRPSDDPNRQLRLAALLRRVMWRTAKADVSTHDLHLPPQHIEAVRVRFGPIEIFHYQSLLRIVRTAFARYSASTSLLNDRALRVSNDLVTMLRQACCHPQIGGSGRRLLAAVTRRTLRQCGPPRSTRELAVQKATKRAETPLDMNEVLDALVAKANAECVDALRSLVASTNGLAAVHLLQFSLLPTCTTRIESLMSAISLYRDVLRISDENGHIAKLDEIQRMHVLFNLNDALKVAQRAKEMLDKKPEKCEREILAIGKLNSLGRTMREGELLEQVDKLRQKYIADSRGHLAATSSVYRDLVAKLGKTPLTHECEYDDEKEDDCSENEPEEDALKRICAQQRGRGEKFMWWEHALSLILEKGKADAFLMRVVEKLMEALPGRGPNAKTLAVRLRRFHSLSYVIVSELRDLQHSRSQFQDTLFRLPGSREATSEEVSESGQCHGCREFGTGPLCKHCRSEGLIIDVERQLYSLQGSLDDESDQENDPDQEILIGGAYKRQTPALGARDPRAVVNGAFISQARNAKSSVSNSSRIRYQSEVETILKSLATALRRYGTQELIAEMTDWFQIFEEAKEEHAAGKRFFEAQRHFLASLDEVNMALMRLSVLEPGENVKDLSEMEARHRVPRSSLGPLRTQFDVEKTTAEADFRAKRGSVVYLRSLKRSADAQRSKKRERDGATAPSNCPVCLSDFDEPATRIAVMSCGHVFCCECMLSMIKKKELRGRAGTIVCPTCRVTCLIDEINFSSTTPQPPKKRPRSNSVDKSPSADSDDVTDLEQDRTGESEAGEGMGPGGAPRRVEAKSSFYDARETVVGLFGAKISATLRLARGIWTKDKGSKIIVFSEWLEVLSLLGHCLNANSISFCDGAFASGSRAFASVVEEFKSSEEKHLILLPLRRAGAGLNLTEASHVILMEPSMNISLEAQAVGRVHRIGQTRETHVHRVVVNHTIEDKILSLGDAYRDNDSNENGRITLDDAIGAISALPRPQVIDLSDDEGLS